MPGEREGYPGIRAVTWMRDKGGDTNVGSNHNITPTCPPAPFWISSCIFLDFFLIFLDSFLNISILN